MSTGTLIVLAAGAALITITGVALATQNQDTVTKQAAMAAELEDAARFATADHIFTGNLHQTIVDTMQAWGTFNQTGAPELGYAVPDDTGITYTAPDVCWRLNLYQKPNNVLVHQVIPCPGQAGVQDFDAGSG